MAYRPGSPAKIRFSETTSPGAAPRTCSVVSGAFHALTSTSPGSVDGTYSRSRWAVSLDNPVSPKVRPATAASTAATDGALRDRCRARSRAAIRSDVGIRLPSRPTRVSSTGTRNNAPRMRRTAPIVTRYSADRPRYTT